MDHVHLNIVLGIIIELIYRVLHGIEYTCRMAKNSRMSKLSSKDDECIFSWKLFTGWDFLIGRWQGRKNRERTMDEHQIDWT